jgi:ABC-type branched-subunit amino acid transport system permease subunit
VQIDSDKKINILLSLLNERYNASHKIRERSFRFAVWLLGLAVALVWVLISGNPLNVLQKIMLTIFVSILGGITFFFLYSLKKGFDNNRKVIIKIEEALGCYKDGIYSDSEALYPNEYKQMEKGSWFFHFNTIYLLIIIVTLIIIILTWVTP